MSDYYQTLVVGDFPQVARDFIDVARLATQNGQPATARLVAETFIQLESDLQRMATETAIRADEAIKGAIVATAKRAVQTGQGPGGGLFNHIHSRTVVPPGTVRIARISGHGGLDELEYWRAQEYGLDEENFVGRTITGFFMDDAQGSNPLVPQPGIDNQPIFGASRGGGRGVIQNPIEPRKFLETGADVATAFWQRERQRAQAKAVKRLRAAITRP